MDSDKDLNSIKEEATRQAADIKASLDSVKTYLSELETIKEEIKSKRTSVVQVSTNAENRQTQIEASHTRISELEKKATELTAKIEAENTKLVGYLATFEATRLKLDHADNGLEAIYTWAQQQKEEIGELLGQSRLDRASVAEMKTSSAQDVEGIATHKKEVEGYRKEIEKVYGFINGQGLAHSFSERQKQLRWPLIIWSVMLFASTCLVSWALFMVFKELPLDPITGKRIFDPASLFYRLSFVSPIILIFVVALKQYSRERRLLESYAFKASTAKALESYTEILARRFPEEKFRHRVLAFVLHAMVGIYRHPNNELNKVDDEKEWAESFGEVAEQVSKPIVDSAKNIISSVVNPAKPIT